MAEAALKCRAAKCAVKNAKRANWTKNQYKINANLSATKEHK